MSPTSNERNRTGSPSVREALNAPLPSHIQPKTQVPRNPGQSGIQPHTVIGFVTDEQRKIQQVSPFEDYVSKARSSSKLNITKVEPGSPEYKNYLKGHYWTGFRNSGISAEISCTIPNVYLTMNNGKESQVYSLKNRDGSNLTIDEARQVLAQMQKHVVNVAIRQPNQPQQSPLATVGATIQKFQNLINQVTQPTAKQNQIDPGERER